MCAMILLYASERNREEIELDKLIRCPVGIKPSGHQTVYIKTLDLKFGGSNQNRPCGNVQPHRHLQWRQLQNQSRKKG